MRNSILYTFLLVFFSSIVYAQSSNPDISVGATYTIGEADYYKHINFPRNNFIIKNGGIANYNKVKGKTVVVTSINERKNGTLVATIKLTSEKKFFNSHKYVTVNINEAINNKELLIN
ncbi:hypothetical protein SAMN06265371_101381 [Lutibacter agarilyticus]|uniref:Dihydroorotase n=1 Tax=Lutibacter agarilyticus TaxID=1109740 RepID=A0A238VG13_9FLAO|nr:dihydroorotase [Lutibacter agarilyticus]SNR33342.1 hypothetical protein SAMN06265371_101381 [Lutibacter agarilyticus]